MSEAQTTDNLDNILDQLGVSWEDKTISPEERFFNYLTCGPMPKIHNLRYWLNHQMSVYQHLREEGLYTTKEIAKLSGGGLTYERVSLTEYARCCIKYYLHMNYIVKFQDYQGQDKCNIETVLDLILDYETIKPTINKKF